jgi:hypothetical protein
MSAFGGKADIVSDSTVTPILPADHIPWRSMSLVGIRQDRFGKLQKFYELSCARPTLTNFGPTPHP